VRNENADSKLVAIVMSRRVRGGRRQERGREGDAECLRGLEVDHHVELGRVLDRQVARLRAFQDAIDIVGSAPERVGLVDPVGHQPAVCGKEGETINSGQAVLGGEGNNRVATHDGEWATQNHSPPRSSRASPAIIASISA
jgi:hypothetical protein